MPKEFTTVVRRSRMIRITRRTGSGFGGVAGTGAGGSGMLSQKRLGKRCSRQGRPLWVKEDGGLCGGTSIGVPGGRSGRAGAVLETQMGLLHTFIAIDSGVSTSIVAAEVEPCADTVHARCAYTDSNESIHQENLEKT